MNFNQNNQLDNQDDIQVDNQDEKNLNKNISCNVFYEQINLINQLPLEERGNVIYMALLNAFIKNQDNQLENQLENTYISISKSISLSILSKSVLDILSKTINCKKYKNNWGGKRESAGRPKGSKPVKSTIPDREEILNYVHSLCKHIAVDDFIAFYEASNWNDKDGLPINWKQKALQWANRYKPTDEPSKSSQAFNEFYEKEKARLAAKGIY